jgi:hypothetical protein
MNQLVVLPRGKALPSEILAAARRDDIVKRMAEHLVAAILHDGLNTSSDVDVITTLYNTPERFPSRVVLDHMDDAMHEAKQTLIAREMGDA